MSSAFRLISMAKIISYCYIGVLLYALRAGSTAELIGSLNSQCSGRIKTMEKNRPLLEFFFTKAHISSQMVR